MRGKRLARAGSCPDPRKMVRVLGSAIGARPVLEAGRLTQSLFVDWIEKVTEAQYEAPYEE